MKVFGKCLPLVDVTRVRPDLIHGLLQILQRRARTKVNVNVSSHAGIVNAAERRFRIVYDNHQET